MKIKERTAYATACVLALCLSAGAGVWFVSSQMQPADDGPLVQVGEEKAGIYEDINTMSDLLDYHDTVVTAQCGQRSQPYSMGVEDVPLPDGTTIDILEWYVDTTYTVEESLSGDLQPGDTITVQEHLESETASPYSGQVEEIGTDSTLLFLIQEGDGYRISTPALSMYPVVLNAETGEKQIVWSTEETNTAMASEDALAYYSEEDLYVDTVEDLAEVLHTDTE